MWGMNVADISVIAGAILTLVFMEGLLSADNALVLAVMVRHLPKGQQKRALRYGIAGAFFFRLIAVLFASTLLKYWIFKVVGGVYLLYLAISHLLVGEEDNQTGTKSRFGQGFWGTVVGVEIADIAFSIDSILAAVALAGGLPAPIRDLIAFVVPVFDFAVSWELLVVYIGGILGIIAMRFVAGYFLILLEKFAGLAIGAYYLVAWIGVKLVGGGFHDALHPKEGVPIPSWHALMPKWVFNIPLEMPEWLFWAGMGLIVVASFFIKPKKTESPIDAARDDAEVQV